MVQVECHFYRLGCVFHCDPRGVLLSLFAQHKWASHVFWIIAPLHKKTIKDFKRLRWAECIDLQSFSTSSPSVWCEVGREMWWIWRPGSRKKLARVVVTMSGRAAICSHNIFFLKGLVIKVCGWSGFGQNLNVSWLFFVMNQFGWWF